MVREHVRIPPAALKVAGARSWLIALHRWCGLAIASFVLAIGATGAALVFRPEIDQWLNADLFAVEPRGATLPTSEILRRVQARHPGARAVQVLYRDRPDESWSVYLDAASSPAEAPALEVFVDPHTGRMIGERINVDVSAAQAPLDRRSLLNLIRRVHFEWLLGETAYRVVGGVGVIWLLTTLAGIYLAWPRNGAWRRTFSIKLSAGPVRAWYDAHRVFGLISSVVLGVVIWTGLWWNLDSLVRPAVATLFSYRGAPDFMHAMPLPPPSSHPAISADVILAAARKQEPGYQPSRLALDWHAGRFIVWMQRDSGSRLVWLAYDMGGGGNAMLVYGMSDGRLVSSVNDRNALGADIYAGLQYPLHTGSYFGEVGRWIWLCAGLVSIVMTITGVYVWSWRRPRTSSAH